MDSTVCPSQAPGGVQSLLCKRLEFPEAAPFQIPVFLDALAEADSIAGAAYDASVSPGEVRVFACMEDAACVSNMGTKLTILLGSLSSCATSWETPGEGRPGEGGVQSEM